MRLSLSLCVPTSVRSSPRVVETASMFGLGLDVERTLTLIPPTTLEFQPGALIFITGASGGGKSTLLRLIAEQARPAARVIRFDALPDPPDAPLVDAFGDLPLAGVLRLLSLAELNDAFVMLRRPCELSDGQRYRFRLAQTIALVEAGPPDVLHLVLADEFGATLDRVTAQVIARNIRKWTRRQIAPPVCFVAATTHDDLLEALEPDVVIEKGLGTALDIATHSTALPGRCSELEQNLQLGPGSWRDYEVLAEHHYRNQRPAIATRILALRHPQPTVIGRFLRRRGQSQTVGVLVESLPALSCRMRNFALRDCYGPRKHVAALNREVRCISRVIVHPQWRGLGLAVRLVRAALAEPTTIFTEALAAMGKVHPFFEHAGMTRYERPPHPFEARLRDALASCGNSFPRWLHDELRRWARARHLELTSDEPEALLRHAQQHLYCEPVYFLSDNRTRMKGGEHGERDGEAGTAGSAPREQQRDGGGVIDEAGGPYRAHGPIPAGDRADCPRTSGAIPTP